MCNSDRKNRFLKEQYPNESTRSTYESILVATSKFELEKDKDLCDFSLSEAIELLIGLKKKTFNSLDVAQTIIVKYIDWCIEEKYSKTFINTFKLIDKEDLKKYTHRIAQRHSYIDRERLYQIAGELYNYIDKAILVLPFEGIRGRTEINHTFEELRNLKYSDIIPELNIVTVTRDDDTQRHIKVDPRTMVILVEAIKETDYHKLNGEAKGRFAVMPLKQTPYILRTLDVESSQDEKITASSIGTRFVKFREYTGVKFLNSTLVFQSGLLEKCAEKEKEVGELKVDDYKQLYRDLNLDDRRYSALKEMYETFKKNKAPS